MNWYIAGALEDERQRGGNAQMEATGGADVDAGDCDGAI